MNSMPPPETMKFLKPLARRIREQFEHRLIGHVQEALAGSWMFRRGDPVFDELRKLIGGHAGVRGHKELMSPWSPPSSAPFTSPLSSEANGSWSSIRMLRRKRLHPVGHEVELDRGRLLAPEGAVIVEYGDAFRRRHEVRRAGRRDLCDEADDRLLGTAVVPRGQRVSGSRQA